MKKSRILVLLLLLFLAMPVKALEVPVDAKLAYNEGVDFYKLGMYIKAIDSFKYAIKLCPDYIDAYYNLGTIYDFLRQYDEALVIFKQIIVRKPQDYESIYKAAQISSKLGEYDKAKEYLTLIPPSSEYYSRAMELAEKLNINIVVPSENNPTSKVNKNSGNYENIVSPTGITTDLDGNVYIACYSDSSIIKITPEGKRILFVKSNKISGPVSLVADKAGNIYVSNYNTGTVLKITKNGALTEFLVGLDKPYGLHIDGNMLFVSCQGANVVIRRRISNR